jgi:drug/metabolite transporter (DMT)-like permease
MIKLSPDDHVARAVAWTLLGIAGGLSLDLFAKELLRTIALLLSIAPRFGGLRSLRTDHAGWHLLRAVLAIGAMFGFFYGLANMPLVNAFTLGYTAPLMMTALSAIFLNEPVGWRRWAAVVTGFTGALIMLRPGGGEVSFASITVLIAAFCYACQAITARKLTDTESTLSLSFYIVLGPMFLALLVIDSTSWLDPDARGWALFAGAGISSVLAWIGLVNGYRAASPALLAPLEYTALVGGAIAAYAIWDEVPDRWVVAGALIIVASGLFVIYRSKEPGTVT